MRTYTLCEIAYLNEVVSRVDTTRRVLQNMGFTGATVDTVCHSEALRRKNVVSLYHSYGNIMAGCLYMLSDALLQDAFFTETSTTRYTLGQMAWAGSIVMHSDSVRRKLRDLGYDKETIDAVAKACRVTESNVAAWWRGVPRDCLRAAQVYLDDSLSSYPPGWPHKVSATPELAF